MLFLRFLFKTPGCHFFLPLSLIRFSFGMFFFASGYNKIFVCENQMAMLETITEAGIPYPQSMAFFVATCEMLAGLLLALGIFSRLNALVLMIISLVALLTVGLGLIPSDLDFLSWYSWLIYLPESNYILICLLLIVQGSGPVSFDRLIVRRLSL